ncbi:hypothetical protein TNCV_4105891 [Trichonephila clavipes]|nr:hypothetical protein TNCV_4105891 [Trichonephila clavipes]
MGCLVTSSSPVPLKTRRVGQRYTLNPSRAKMCPLVGVVVRIGGASSGVVHVTLHHSSNLRGPSPKALVASWS